MISTDQLCQSNLDTEWNEGTLVAINANDIQAIISKTCLSQLKGKYATGAGSKCFYQSHFTNGPTMSVSQQ